MWFAPYAWSPDGRLLAGRRGLQDRGLVIRDLATGAYQSFDLKVGSYLEWLKDVPHLVSTDKKAIWLFHTNTGEKKKLWSAPPWTDLAGGCPSPDSRWIYTALRTQTSDVWVLEFK